MVYSNCRRLCASSLCDTAEYDYEQGHIHLCHRGGIVLIVLPIIIHFLFLSLSELAHTYYENDLVYAYKKQKPHAKGEHNEVSL